MNASTIRKEIKKVFNRHFVVRTGRECDINEFHVSNGDCVDMTNVAEHLTNCGFLVKFGLPYSFNKNCMYVKIK